MYYYKRTEPGLWTVGIDTATGWQSESDHDSTESAAERVAILNGGTPKADLPPGKRDQFAMAALANFDSTGLTPEGVARRAFQIADAMMFLSSTQYRKP